jgi:predicted transcriptional regulator
LSAVFGFRLPDDLRQYLQAQADAQRTTISHYLVTLILRDMEREREGNQND